MFHMTEKEYEEKLNKIRLRNESIERMRKLKEERNKYKPTIKLPSTSKIVLIISAILCVEILFFCQYMIIITGDTNALYAMVGTIAALASIVLGYFVKSTKENTDGGVTYLNALAQLGQPLPAQNTEAVG